MSISYLDRNDNTSQAVHSSKPQQPGPIVFFKQTVHNVKCFGAATWRDWVFLLLVGGLTVGVSILQDTTFSPPAFTILFPLVDSNGVFVLPELSYPYIQPIFSPVGAGVLAATLPIAIFAISQLQEHSFIDFAAAFLGLGYSMITGTCVQVILKKTIGGLRPHFLSVCQPVIPPWILGSGFGSIMYSADQVCTSGQTKAIRTAQESFPSGHAEVAFAGLGFAALYLFTHLRVYTPQTRPPEYWKMLLVVAPVLLATYLSATLVRGYHHHVGDVVFGAAIRICMAFFGYTMVYRAILDDKWNTMVHLRLDP